MVFQKFKAWLLQIYRNLTALNVELSDEMRQVFDRMSSAVRAERIRARSESVNLLPSRRR